MPNPEYSILGTVGEYFMQIQSLTEFKPFLQNSKILRHWRDSWEAVVLKMPQNHQFYPKNECFFARKPAID